MKFSVKLIALIFVVFIGLFTFYQFLVGNPFFDTFHPAWMTLLFFILGVMVLIAVFRKKKTE